MAYNMKHFKPHINRNRKELISKEVVDYKSLSGDSLINKLCFVWDDDYSKRQLDIVISFECYSKYNQDTNTLIKTQKYTTMLGSWINAQSVLIADIKHLLVEYTPPIKTKLNLTKPEKPKPDLKQEDLDSDEEDEADWLDESNAKWYEENEDEDDNFFDPNM